MRVLLFATFLAVGTWTASASAQFGLYGSPEMLNLPQTESTLLPESGGSATPASYSSPWSARPAPNQPAYPATAQPVVQRPVYAPATRPVAQPTYPTTAHPAYGPARPAQAAPQAAYRSAPQQAPPQAAYRSAPQQAPPQAAYIPAPRQAPPQAPYVRAPRQAPPQAAYAQPNAAYGTPTPPKAPATPAPVAPAVPAVPQPPLKPQPATSNMVDQMLGDPASNGGVYAGYGTDCSPVAEAACGECEPIDYCPWYASVAALALSRNEANPFFWSANAAYSPEQCGIVQLGWRAGVEVRFGRRFCCCPCEPCDPCDPGGSSRLGGWAGAWALEGAYWTVVGGFTGERVCRYPAGVVTPINLDFVQFYNTPADWNMATDIIDGAVEHRVWRHDEIHNVEVNLLREGMLNDPYRPLDVNWGVGLRYFRFDERLVFAALHNGTWGADPTNEAYIDVRDENNLVGFQFTADLNYYLSPNWRVFFTPRVGIYGNCIEHYFHVYRGDGVAARSTDPAVPGGFPIRSNTTGLSFLTQLDLGVNWAFARNWGAAIGYRAVVATGIALADNQIPPYLVDLPEIARIDRNGELILHGAFASVTYNF